MLAEVREPTDDLNVSGNLCQKRDLLQNCGRLRWTLPGKNVCGELINVYPADIHDNFFCL